MKFINYELKQHGYQAISDERVIDTLAIARGKFPGAPASLDALCRRFDVDLSSRTKHGALLDAELLAEVYIELCGGKQVGIDFKVPDDDTQQSSTQAALTRIIEARSHIISSVELEAHQQFVSELDNAIWRAYKPA